MEITPFAATRIAFAATSKVSQKDKDKYHTLPDAGSKMTQTNLYTKQKQTHRRGEQTAVTKGRVGRRDGLEFGMNRCKLVYTGCINKVLL